MPGRRKILFVSETLPWPPLDGRRIPIYYLTRYLSNHYQIDLLAFRDLGEEISDTNLTEMRDFYSDIEIFPQAPLTKLRIASSFCSRYPRSLSRFKVQQFQDRLDRWTNYRDYSLVHFFGINMAQFGGRIKRIPTLLAPHDCVSLALRRRSASSAIPLLRRLDHWQEAKRMSYYEANMIPKFGRWYVVSPVDQQALMAISPGARVGLVPNGVDAEYFSPIRPSLEDSNILVLTGAFQTSRDVEAVKFITNRVLPLIHLEFPGARVLLAGGKPHPEILALTEANPNLEVTGFLDDLRPEIARGSVYLCGLLTGTGIKNRVLEALSMAKATVTTSIGAEGLDLHHGEHFMVADDPEDFAHQVVRLLRDPYLRLRMGDAARQAVRTKYSWQIAVDRVLNLYNELIGQGSLHQLSNHNARC